MKPPMANQQNAPTVIVDKSCQTLYNCLMIDMTGIPTPICPMCDSNLLRITATFDEETYEIATYLLHSAECAECGCLLTAPTPLDHPDYVESSEA